MTHQNNSFLQFEFTEDFIFILSLFSKFIFIFEDFYNKYVLFLQ